MQWLGMRLFLLVQSLFLVNLAGPRGWHRPGTNLPHVRSLPIYFRLDDLILCKNFIFGCLPVPPVAINPKKFHPAM